MAGEIVFAATAFVCALGGAFYDVRQHRIPNAISYGGICAGLVLRSSTLGWKGLLAALAGGLLAGGLFLLVYISSGMGAGDVKLMAAVGTITGPSVVLQIIMVCALAGGIMALCVMLWRRTTWTTLRNVGQLIRFRIRHAVQVHPTINLNNPAAIRLPYGLAIVAGTAYPVLNYFIAR